MRCKCVFEAPYLLLLLILLLLLLLLSLLLLLLLLKLIVMKNNMYGSSGKISPQTFVTVWYIGSF